MIKCEKCGKPAPVGTLVTESGVVTTFEIVSNPKTGKMQKKTRLVTKEIDCSCENNYCMLWLCPSCGTENDIAAELESCEFDSTSDTHSTCENCGKKWRNDADLNHIPYLMERVAPGEPMPSGECPDCGCLCHPSKD